MDEVELEELLDWILDPALVKDGRVRSALRIRAREWLDRRREPIALQQRSGRVVLGIDVSAARGLDVVVLDGALRTTRIANVRLEVLERLVKEVAPEAIAIDSPPAWARSGASRVAERELSRLRISAYGVPAAGLQTEFHAWMRVGFSVFEAVRRLGYSRYTGGPAAQTALEVFPYASAVALAGYRPQALQGSRRVEWRKRVLAESGVQIDVLRSADQVDAALAALTALCALQGRCVAVGDPEEGVIVLPVRDIPQGGWPIRAA